MKLQKDIPILFLEEITRKGLSITRYQQTDDQDMLLKAVHRDDHYVFVFQLLGKSRIMVDFNEITLNGRSVLCILPGQVHQGISAFNVDALFIAIEAALIKDSLQSIFEEKVPIKGSVNLNEDDALLLEKSIELLMDISLRSARGNLQAEIGRSFTDTCIGMIACAFDSVEDSTHGSHLRTVVIARQFKRLLSQSYKTERMPSGYAGLMNISTSYLNEAVKLVTGFPASYWIRQQVVIEAKRVLFYTDCSVKQISAMLGFEDHHYFSRFFTKGAGMSPMSFRQKYRE
ncbi:helix-turn-helix domain-containing protein [Dyadobacter sp. CY356]|uniref:helix-turn-helix domain-containing protein n=1 Tax=Dyadobacter sp. CY356 TaxID=2906442 RepID=UPI001F1FF55C|nr:helix-turn-helix domain-containing protein [Dyadobacter sp. CY356]MCF0054779.1 AraC family transcriptional regulator [Dyadobacter sp. CY356]